MEEVEVVVEVSRKHTARKARQRAKKHKVQ